MHLLTCTNPLDLCRTVNRQHAMQSRQPRPALLLLFTARSPGCSQLLHSPPFAIVRSASTASQGPLGPLQAALPLLQAVGRKTLAVRSPAPGYNRTPPHQSPKRTSHIQSYMLSPRPWCLPRGASGGNSLLTKITAESTELV
jgi:hypothetical protein